MQSPIRENWKKGLPRVQANCGQQQGQRLKKKVGREGLAEEQILRWRRPGAYRKTQSRRDRVNRQPSDEKEWASKVPVPRQRWQAQQGRVRKMARARETKCHCG